MKKYIILGIASLPVLFLSACGTPTAKTTIPANHPAETEKAAISLEGGNCTADAGCETGLKCIIASAINKCSSGKVGSVCATYKDCGTGLYCVKSICSNPPSYVKYFDKIVVAKMKPGPPGPENIPMPATEFKANVDAMEIDVTPKAGITGEVYYEFIDSTTGERVMSSANNKMPVGNGSSGTGFQIPGNLAGDFELNIYFNNELIHTVAVKITR
jgi:hypothetical protein